MAKILRRLEKCHGRPEWKRWGGGVSVLVGTILSQNTSAANSTAGYRQLRRALPRWEQVAAAPVEHVERCIRVSGLSRLKAPRIQQILRQLRREHGRITLEHLAGMDPRRAYEYLRSFPGVGPKTANCVLLFSFHMPVFPVDTHIERIARRLGLVEQDASAEQVQDQLTPHIAPEDRYAMHILLIAHGRQTCRARRPLCDDCVLADLCPRAEGAGNGG
jgi:endonuclease III